MSLPIFVTQDKWQDFDEAWNELMTGDGAIDELLVALKLAGDKKRISRCVPLVRAHFALLEANGSHAEAAQVIGSAIAAGAPTAELGEALLRNAEAAWGTEAWWPRAVELCGLNDPSALRPSWRQFIKLRRLTVGAVVFHPSGWGVGEIVELSDTDSTVHVKFHDGRLHKCPMATALDIFEPLEPGDLRSQYLKDPAELVKRVKKEPLDALRAVLERYHGRASSIGIKNALAQVGVEGSSFSAWWRKAKRLAENSEWFRLSGSGKKIDVHLLLTAADPEAQLTRQLDQAADLEDIIARSRALFAGKNVSDSLTEIANTRLAEQATNEDEDYSQRLGAWMLLRESQGETSEAFKAVLQEARETATEGSEGLHAPALWRLFNQFPSTHDQERATELLIELFGKSWMDEALANLTHAAPGMVRGLVERILTAKKQRELGAHYSYLLTRPTRAPHLIIALGKLAEAGKLEGRMPPKLDRARAYATLAAHLYSRRRATAHEGRAHTKLVDLLASGAAPLLDTLLDEAKKSEVHSVQILTQRGVEETIDNLLIAISMHAEDDLDGGDSQHFWDDESIWTTRRGLERIGSELKELKEVKMPANEQAIGEAASRGDLSENSEWEAAIEEKRNLSARVGSMEADLARVQLLEHAILPEDTVSPGTRVLYREEGEDRSITLLGPWDSEGSDDIVSYRAPLAQGLLGLHAGDVSKVTLPGGEITVEVLSIEPVDVE
ncbi:MAG TPA: hypothetical protein EYG30_09610 [Planctomycetes bacterium]|nr:hypothetical protein [Planctomycetota bacterium]